jgi:hypothetical protein
MAEQAAGVAATPIGEIAFRNPVSSGLFRIALQAGLLGVIANIIPLGIGMILTGILAALLYHRAAGHTLASGRAVRLGAMAGAIAFAASSFLSLIAVVLSHTQNQIRDLMMKAVEQRAANPQDPDVQAVLQWLHTPQGFAAAFVLGMLGALFLSVLFSTIGCIIGAVLFRDRNRPFF